MSYWDFVENFTAAIAVLDEISEREVAALDRYQLVYSDDEFSREPIVCERDLPMLGVAVMCCS